MRIPNRMLRTSSRHVNASFRENRLLHTLAGGYLLVWIIAAIRPLSPSTWLLENVLVVVFVSALVLTYRRLPLSDLSYTLITLFMVLHAVGAHYTYSRVPIGFWLKEQFGFSRNHYDRIVHFAFGLLITYPIREALVRITSLKGFWSYYLPFSVTVASSALFELVEWSGASLTYPDLGAQYLGMQGDIWDAHKDMLIVTIGALVCMVLVARIKPAHQEGGDKAPRTAAR
jgi:putative membrane protein